MHIAALAVAGIAAFADLRTGLMPNRVTLGALALGLAVRPAIALAETGVTGLSTALVSCAMGAVVTAIVPFVLWRGKALGGGDVKLFVALGVLLGPVIGLEAQLFAFASGALILPFVLAWRGRLLPTLGRSLLLVTNLFSSASRRRAIPSETLTWFRFGPMILVGTALAILARSSLR
jgi:prepilin peptidase CpaA